jgi:hypothetical protein
MMILGSGRVQSVGGRCSVCSSELGSGGVLANKRLDGAGVPVARRA